MNRRNSKRCFHLNYSASRAKVLSGEVGEYRFTAPKHSSQTLTAHMFNIHTKSEMSDKEPAHEPVHAGLTFNATESPK